MLAAPGSILAHRGLAALLAVSALALGAVLAARAAGDEPEPPDPAALLAGAQRTQARDLEAWQGWAFRRQVVRRRLDAEGEVTFRQDLDFRVEPAPGGGFEETLIAIDGRAPTPREVREHRREARFTAHYRRAREGKLGGVLGAGELDFGYLFRALSYRYLGRETVGGADCHHLAIDPVGAGSGAEVDPLAAATAGELWLTVDGLHVARAATRLTRPVSQGLVAIDRLEIHFDGQPADRAWLPRRIELRSALGGFLRLRAHNSYTYSELEGRPRER